MKGDGYEKRFAPHAPAAQQRFEQLQPIFKPGSQRRAIKDHTDATTRALRALLPLSSEVRTRELPGLGAVCQTCCPLHVSKRACREGYAEGSKR